MNTFSNSQAKATSASVTPVKQYFTSFTETLGSMSRIAASEVFEAENLLEKVDSWTDEEIEELPKLYREKAREYRGLTNSGEE